MSTEYAIYLRKSRADLEAEAHGEGDTLARHEHILMELAKSRALPIGAIYREIVSGERIANRPVMQQLLSEVEDGRWKGVLVTETSRLARGDTIDQGIVAQAFKFSGTLIVTPSKTYDPTQEADEEWMEFGLFMSRQEYRMIRRRMTEAKFELWVSPIIPPTSVDALLNRITTMHDAYRAPSRHHGIDDDLVHICRATATVVLSIISIVYEQVEETAPALA